jgi:hypothetical protein
MKYWIFLWKLHIRLHLYGIALLKNATHLAGWKRLYMSKEGKLTLIKNTLSNFPTYYLSMFPIPVGVTKGLKNFRRTFCGGNW